MKTPQLRKKPFPHYKQSDKMDCGPTCLKMVARSYGKRFSLQYLRDLCEISYQGVSASGIENAAKKLGFKTLIAELPFDKLSKVPLPCIAHWDKSHFVVIWKMDGKHVYVGDPSHQRTIKYECDTFLDHWALESHSESGRVILLEATPDLALIENNEEPPARLLSLLRNIKTQRAAVFKVFLTLLIASLLTLAIPLLTQAIVDKGISKKNISILGLICIGQILLFVGRTATDFIRSRILFRLGMHISLDILSAFLTKLTNLRLSFFDKRHSGDNLQRIYDNQRVEEFLTKHSVGAVLSAISLFVYGSLLSYYNWKIFIFFAAVSLIGILWNNSFEEKRRSLDQRTFNLLASNQRLQIEIFEAMQEIKLTGSEQEKNQIWRQLQEETYDVKLENLKMDQYIQGVGLFINESKNIITTYFAALMVIEGHLTLGGMLAITYIYGALNGPINQLTEFMRAGQMTRFSLQRINEVQHEPEEDVNSKKVLPADLQINGHITLDHVSFRYGASAPEVLKNISLQLPAGKVTAIVGMSGSGKTTLIKLLLKFYSVNTGTITVAGQDLHSLNAQAWRKHCGVVLQDSFIFSDTIAGNIWIGAAEKDMKKVVKASLIANLDGFINTLPFGYDTPIGTDGVGLSEGQKQRLLIARLVYRNPDFIFLDEATNSLDANNEKMIIENLNVFFQKRTVIVVAHRLSTVKNADNIVVLQDGCIVEQGTHQELSMLKGAYYNLVKNQLELGK